MIAEINDRSQIASCSAMLRHYCRDWKMRTMASTCFLLLCTLHTDHLRGIRVVCTHFAR